MFQNLRANSTIYILHKEAKPYVETAAVTSVTPPKPKYPFSVPQPGQLPQIQQMSMVVDVTASSGGQQVTFQGLPAGTEIADSGQNGNVVISCSRDAMNSEIAAMRQRSIEIIDSVPYHQGVVASCDEMLDRLNPEVAEKKRQDREISDLKKQMADLMEMNRRLMQSLGGSGTIEKKEEEI